MIPPPPDANAASITANLRDLRARIAAAATEAGRAPESVTLIAVSKTHPAEAVSAAIAAGQRHFGENRVQEAARKFASIPAGAIAGESLRPILHIIGPLQTNKARDAVRIADVIESLDRPRLADAIADAMAREDRAPDLLVQVNIGREPQKAGVAPEDADRFIEACMTRFGARLRGLMCVPPANDDPGPHFEALAILAARHGLGILSMGMSGDWRVAVSRGATWVRLGSAVFGARPAPTEPAG